MSTYKGCSYYYKILTKKTTLSNNIYVRENKWHLELHSRFSINFWNNSRNLCASIDFDNQLKWLQFQIIRNSLQTNYIVSHFKPNVSPICKYCENPAFVENVSHLFWFCPKVSDFLIDIFAFVCSTGLVYTPTREQFIFGYHNQSFFQPKNYITLVVKKYIWKTKFKSVNLTMVGFKSLLKSYICDLKFIFELKNTPERFNEWNTIYNLL